MTESSPIFLLFKPDTGGSWSNGTNISPCQYFQPLPEIIFQPYTERTAGTGKHPFGASQRAMCSGFCELFCPASQNVPWAFGLSAAPCPPSPPPCSPSGRESLSLQTVTSSNKATKVKSLITPSSLSLCTESLYQAYQLLAMNKMLRELIAQDVGIYLISMLFCSGNEIAEEERKQI